MNTCLHQIYYSPQSRAELDPGFLPLDNLSNPRPDWREYWPIRRFLLSNSLEPESYYGFLSPKFKHKTGLSSAAVYEFIGGQTERPDVLLFSPYFDQIAFFLNIVEQGCINHPVMADTLNEAAALMFPGFRSGAIFAIAANTVFCNNFVAKPRFWSEWLVLLHALKIAFVTQGVEHYSKAFLHLRNTIAKDLAKGSR